MLLELDLEHTSDRSPFPSPATQDHVAWRSVRRGAEYLTLADLSLRGIACYLPAEGMRYDVVADLPDWGLCRIQVKSSECSRLVKHCRTGPLNGYIFEIAKNGATYHGAADAFAFVALDKRAVYYARVGDVPRRRLVLKPSEFSAEACDLSFRTGIPQSAAGRE